MDSPCREEWGLSDYTQDDVYLVNRAQEGYFDAYQELASRYAVRMYRTALRLLSNHEDAQDVAQDASINAWRRLEHFRGQSAYSTWLYRIVTRLALNKLQRDKPVDSLELLPDLPSADDSPPENLERHEVIDAVTDAVAALPIPQRVVVVLHHFEGLSYAEVAAITGSSVPAVRSHLFRARRSLTYTLREWR
ncbi:MAG: sigma-70 family RNA polymerase sigma factor [Geodermatophilaceae bacterium]|jgi:RNA polymerase sigma-70 factor (ECF subfamily)|nr:sigma-70 family RNA polymerase sigma factor [Geodermatophilaceae bacterium]